MSLDPLGHCERRLRERGAIRLTAIVADDEDGAMSFWRAAGYERQEHRARFVRGSSSSWQSRSADGPGPPPARLAGDARAPETY